MNLGVVSFPEARLTWLENCSLVVEAGRLWSEAVRGGFPEGLGSDRIPADLIRRWIELGAPTE